MYLIHGDEELAAQSFAKSQANDPENAAAWIGQAVIAIRNHDLREAQDLYVHAFEIGERSLVLHGLGQGIYLDYGKLPIR
jgi:superkiller protein 3